MLEAHLLGQFNIRLDDKPVEILSRPAQSLFAYLLTNPAVPQRREKLAGLFWPDASEENARRSLRQALWHIRKACEPANAAYIQTDDFTIRINLAVSDWVDVLILERNLPADPTVQELLPVVSSYNGELLPGFYEDWVILARERLQVVFERRISQLIDHLIAGATWEDVLNWSERWITLGTTPEPAYRALMMSYHALGNPSAITVTYQRCMDALERELGISPSELTRNLYQSLLNESAIRTPIQETVPCASVSVPETDLPPFKGLQFFEEEDAELFFGREQLTSHLVKRISNLHEGTKLLAIVGPSGSGKSSLARAGLMPALKNQSALTGAETQPQHNDRWEVFLVVPASHPLESLAACLTQDSTSISATATLIDDLEADSRSLGLYFLKRWTVSEKHKHPKRVLLVIDQFEEVFTQCREESERRAFIDNLLIAAETEKVWVILTLRADFYAACAQYPALREALAAQQEYIGRMTTPELRRVIEEPARSRGWDFEPGLVDLILRDIGLGPPSSDRPAYPIEPGALPLLSHALLATWKRRKGCTMTLAGYAEAGGVRGAIARTAETTYALLSPDEQRIARGIFLQLTELGDADNGEFTPMDTRRRVAIAEFSPSGEKPGEVDRVLKILTDARLLTTGEATIEVAHEALIREWPTLQNWLSEDREGLRLHRRLSEAAQGWQALDCEPGELYRGARLAQAQEWVATHPNQLNALEAAFLDASQVLADREADEREVQRSRELEAARQLAEVTTRRAEEQSRTNRRLRRQTAGLGIFLIAAIVLGAFFLQQRNRAEQQTRLAASRELAASAVANLDVDPQRSVLLALRALSFQDTMQAEDALHQSVQSLRLRRIFPLENIWGFTAIFSPDGTRLAASSGGPDKSPTTEIWDIASGKHLLSLPGILNNNSWTQTARLATIAAGQGNTTLVRFWNPDTGNMISSTVLDHLFNDEYGDFDAGQTHAVETLADGTTVVSDLNTGKLLFRIGMPGNYSASFCAAFSPDGKQLVASEGGFTRMFDVNNGQELFPLPSVDFGDGAATFSPDGSRLAVGLGPLIKIVDTTNGKELLTLSGHSGLINALAFNADGTSLASGASDSSAIIWDTSKGQIKMKLMGSSEAIHSIHFSPDGMSLITSSFDQAARLWDISPAGGESKVWYDPMGRPFTGVAFSPDGSKLAASGGGGGGYIWNAASGKILMKLEGQGAYIGSVAYSPDGQHIAITNGSELVDILDTASGRKLRTLYGHALWVGGLAFSPDGKRLVTISYDQTAVMWDALFGQELFSIQAIPATVDQSNMIGVAFSPDGSRFATTSNYSAKIWDSSTGREILSLPQQTELVYSVAFSPDGRRLVTGLALGQGAVVWDSQTGAKLLTLTGQRGSIQGIVFSRDNKQIITGSVDGTIKIWDANTGTELMTLARQTSEITGLTLSPDGSRLAAASLDGTVRIYDLHIDDLIKLARSELSRGFSLAECRDYLHQAACPNE